MNCKYETEWCKNHMHCLVCSHYVIPEGTTLFKEIKDYKRDIHNGIVTKTLTCDSKLKGDKVI